MFCYTIVRSQRKTTVIQITKDANVIVRAPLNLPQAKINRLVYSNSCWILKKLDMKREQLLKKAEFKLDYGRLLLFRGKEFPIVARDGDSAGFDEVCFYFPGGLMPEEIKQAAILVYKTLAKQTLTNRVMFYGEKMNLIPSAIKINNAKARWGSCSGKNSLNFSWQLVMGDDAVIDYVVVHELSHIAEHNHSDRFWELVASVLPDFKERREALKRLHTSLSIQNWD